MRYASHRVMVAGLALGAMLVAGTGRQAVAAEERGTWASAGLGIGSMLSNVVYMPAKLVYAGLGAVTGGLTYVLTGGSYDTAQNVWVASLGGTYVITPDMLTGERPVEFTGTPRANRSAFAEEPSGGPEAAAPADDGYARDSYY